MAGEADREQTLSASACLIGGSNSVNPGQILLVYRTVVIVSRSLFPIISVFFQQLFQRKYGGLERKARLAAATAFVNSLPKRPPTRAAAAAAEAAILQAAHEKVTPATATKAMLTLR